jgi:hypothetical protein
MTLVLADRVKETTTSTGTTAITLAGAATGYQTFSSAVGNANTTYYTIADQTGANWEVGIGTYTSSGNTLSRDTILASSNAGSLVTFTAGTKDVFITYPAERALYTGGPLGTPSSGTLTNATGYTYANLSGTVPTWNQSTTGNATTATTAATATNLASGSVGTIPYQTASGTTAMLAVGTSGQVLTSNGASAPTWAAASGGGTKTISNKTGAYTVVVGDLGAIINCTSGTFTVSLTAAASLGSGFTCTIWNTGTGAITIDPNASETIDGVATLILRQGEGLAIVCNGTNWETDDKKPMRGYAENIPASLARPTASGNRSIALGYASSATGGYDIALGGSANSSANAATAIGYYAAANGSFSTAIGIGATTYSTHSTAIGQNSAGNGSQTVTGDGAMALGGSYASGTDSFAAAIANNTSSYGATGYASVAIGYQAKASGFSLAIGSGTNAQGSNSMAIGPIGTNGATTQAIGTFSSAIGAGAYARNNYSTALGYNADGNKVGKLAIGTGTYSGDNVQSFITGLYTITTTTTAISLTPAGTSALSTTNSLGIADYGAISIQGTMVAKPQYASVMNFYTISGAAFRDASNNMVANSLTLTLVGSDNIGLGAAPTIGIDNTNKCINITSGYKSATTIFWSATVIGTELKG